MPERKTKLTGRAPVDGIPEGLSPQGGEDWLRAQHPGCVLVGVDEVGRGPLAGPVVAAAVVLDPARPIAGLDDSKKLTAAKREALVPLIQERAILWAIGEASAEEIDRYNILGATFIAMRRALVGIGGVQPDWRIAVDGNHRIRDVEPTLQIPVVKGDARVACIAAASILAKVHRDKLMADLDAVYPGYGFAVHAGYPVPMHIEAIRERGYCHEHRRSFHLKALEQFELGF